MCGLLLRLGFTFGCLASGFDLSLVVWVVLRWARCGLLLFVV